jgi:hypothetical protein
MSGRLNRVEWRFVDYIPEELEPGVIYIAPEYGAVIHLCLDGCGERISTPLSPAQWAITFDGETISLWPSVGNWDLPCRSHYIIRKNQVIWAKDWDDDTIAAGARRDRRAVERHFTSDVAQESAARPARRSIFNSVFGRHRKKPRT